MKRMEQSTRNTPYTICLSRRLPGDANPAIVVTTLIPKATKLRRVPSGKCFGLTLPVGMTLGGVVEL